MTTMTQETPPRTGIGVRKDYHALNAQLNLFAPDGSIQFDKDQEAAEEYLRQHVTPNTKTFSSVHDRLDWLVEHDYYEPEFLAAYTPDFISGLHEHAYGVGHRFHTFLGRSSSSHPMC